MSERHEPTHPHGWRDAPRAGLAVTKPEGAVVPGKRRVELQVMPVLLQGRRIRSDLCQPYSVCVARLPHAMQGTLQNMSFSPVYTVTTDD